MDKEFILAESRRTTEANGGKALGCVRFEQQTGIGSWDWQKYWDRYNDLVREAGSVPNEFGRATDPDFLCEAYATFAAELGRLPRQTELVRRRRNDSSFPSPNSFKPKSVIVAKLVEWCRARPEFLSVHTWCEEYLRSPDVVENSLRESTDKEGDGFVYLAKTRRGYKIGRTDDWEQRLRQIQLHNADDVQLVHLIKTDDPSGVEAYWHRRFKTKRVVTKSKTGRRRNWYNLTVDDVRAFKRWRQI